MTEDRSEAAERGKWNITGRAVSCRSLLQRDVGPLEQQKQIESRLVANYGNRVLVNGALVLLTSRWDDKRVNFEASRIDSINCRGYYETSLVDFALPRFYENALGLDVQNALIRKVTRKLKLISSTGRRSQAVFVSGNMLALTRRYGRSMKKKKVGNSIILR